MRTLSARKKKKERYRLILLELILLGMSMCIFFYLMQRYWAHREGVFVPDYVKVELTEDADYETIFLQTGLGRAAVEKLLAEGNFAAVLKAQEVFFEEPKMVCTPLLGWFTREDRLTDSRAHRLVDLQPGDIIVTLSTHSLGWGHGHAALVIDADTTLECMVLGTDSTFANVDGWTDYANYAVLRVKGATLEERQAVADYAANTLVGIPYRLSAGFIGDKAPHPQEWQFGLQCSYLVWYAWNHFGYDLDSDGGRLVTTNDILYSDKLEVVQIYGMNPESFMQ